MKPLDNILSLPENSSFVIHVVGSDWFETGWHNHAAYELYLFEEGSGQVFINEQTTPFEKGDVFFLGSRLPYRLQKNRQQPISAVIIQFTEDCLGAHFLHLPECREIKQILKTAQYGIKIAATEQTEIQSLMKSLISAKAIDRILLFLKCLQWMIESKKKMNLLLGRVPDLPKKNNDFIERITWFTLQHFHSAISLRQAASAVCMSVPSFCLYFKQYMATTYINYLNRIRVEYACQQLNETNKPVTDIGYECGYNTVAHFHRQFLRIKKATPLQYRKAYKQI